MAPPSGRPARALLRTRQFAGSPAVLSLPIFGGTLFAAKICWDGTALKGDPPARCFARASVNG
jgi:hypothetical protein